MTNKIFNYIVQKVSYGLNSMRCKIIVQKKLLLYLEYFLRFDGNKIFKENHLVRGLTCLLPRNILKMDSLLIKNQRIWNEIP